MMLNPLMTEKSKKLTLAKTLMMLNPLMTEKSKKSALAKTPTLTMPNRMIEKSKKINFAQNPDADDAEPDDDQKIQKIDFGQNLMMMMPNPTMTEKSKKSTLAKTRRR